MEKDILKTVNKETSEAHSFLLKAKEALSKNELDSALSNIVDCLRLSDKYYYEATLIKAKVLIAKANLEASLKLLEEELSMPYIPAPFNKEFEELYDSTLKELNAQKKSYSPFDLLDDEELKEKFNLSTDLNTLMLLASQIDKRNVRNFLDVIKTKLVSETNNSLKTLLLEILTKQGINEEIKLVKNNLELTVIPTCLSPVIDELIMDKINEEINILNRDNNISIEQLVNLYAINYLADIYPMSVEEEEIQLLSKALFIKANLALNNKIEIEENKFLTYYLEKLDNISVI